MIDLLFIAIVAFVIQLVVIGWILRWALGLSRMERKIDQLAEDLLELPAIRRAYRAPTR